MMRQSSPVLYLVFWILLSLLTRNILPNLGLLILGLPAFLLAMLPFAIPLRKRA